MNLKNLNTVYSEKFATFFAVTKNDISAVENANGVESFRSAMQYLNFSNLSHCPSKISLPFLKIRY